MKEIQLTRGYVALVDDEDYEELMKFRWHVLIKKNGNYASRKQRLSEKFPGKTTDMHRHILKLNDNDSYVDHIDGDGLNNQKSNIRKCSRSENNQNCISAKGSSSKYVGVHFDGVAKTPNQWRSIININGKITHFPRRNNEIEAALDRDNFIIENNLMFPKLNILSRDGNIKY